MTTRDWLRQNDYEDVAELIDEVMAARAARGSKERRNWWDVLAGGKDGRPNVVAGREFPVLRIAQARQGKPITPNAICRNNDERPPDMVRTGRWADPATWIGPVLRIRHPNRHSRHPPLARYALRRAPLAAPPSGGGICLDEVPLGRASHSGSRHGCTVTMAKWAAGRRRTCRLGNAAPPLPTRI